ncbi:mechanosensitive ion channel [Alkalicaulis satelles]|uniref:Mechanosensitive ion channel n=1 Tax=Alkalicaulis satelles TaxID=2609175 RepID=A0A5M6ZK88_9PROT|nr:mechanosensitive ion channel domain-containing protein [Alkalicaulis satelles]KAA5804750.1 mechanosensitive ion channel [Alkalicaulis satelles]
MTQPQGQPGSAIDDIVPLNELQARLIAAYDWFEQSVLNWDNGVQLALITAAVIPALIFGPRLRALIVQSTSGFLKTGWPRRLINAAAMLMTPLALLAALTLFQVVLAALERPYALVNAATSLMTAWIVIRAVSLVIQSKFWSNIAFYIAWPIAVLDVFGLLVPVIAQMQALAIPLGVADDGSAIQLSLFDIVRTLVYFGVLFWLASLAGRAINTQLDRSEELSPAFKALISKVLGVVLPVTALLIALQMTGFNLATLAIFSGAVGIGVGLGLQKTVANFAAGFTLLADKSIKPGDAIEVDGTFGWVSEMQSRYVSIRTRDGTEMLIPNEHFIANGVINWSRSDRIVRLHAPFGVSYKTRDLRKVQEIALKAAASVARVVPDKEPTCNLMEFGDSSVNFELRFWIADPEAGLSNVRSEVYFALWEALHEEGIEIPFPQIDLHVKETPAVSAPA